MSIQRGLGDSFKFAFSGIKEAFKNEPNLKIHLVIAVLAVISAFFLKFSAIEWVVLFSVITLVFTLELINTSLEAVVDLVSPDIKEKAKVAKDVAAASVLLSAIFALLAGLLLFLPKIFATFLERF